MSLLAQRARRGACVLACLLAVLAATGCSSGRSLEKWHTQQLGEEYRVARSDEVRSLQAYLALEERLFAELDRKIYEPAQAGPEHALLRFTRGSASDPLVREPNWNRTFVLRAGRPVGGVLLLHGMSDSPYSLRALGESLHARGYTVVGLRLPGHGTAPSGLLRVRWEDMAGAVRLAIAQLHDEVGDAPLHIVGYSAGATLALDYALDAIDGAPGAPVVPASLVLVSPAIGIHSAAALAQWRRRTGSVPGLGGLVWLNVEPEFDPYKYNSFATNAGEQVHRLTREVARRIDRLASEGRGGRLPPILVFKSNADATVTNEAVVDRLLGRLGDGRHELVLFDVNRQAAKSLLLVADPRALTQRLSGDATLPFTVTLVTNLDDVSTDVVARRQPPRTGHAVEEAALGQGWPTGVLSLSHVALPIPPDDPLYGVRPPENAQALFLGDMALRGERGMLQLSSDWLLRLRHNPFYDYLEQRSLEWIAQAGKTKADATSRAAPAD